MKRKPYPEQQIVAVVKRVETGTAIVEICREYVVSEATVHRWKKRYGVMDISQVRKVEYTTAGRLSDNSSGDGGKIVLKNT